MQIITFFLFVHSALILLRHLIFSRPLRSYNIIYYNNILYCNILRYLGPYIIHGYVVAAPGGPLHSRSQNPTLVFAPKCGKYYYRYIYNTRYSLAGSTIKYNVIIIITIIRRRQLTNVSEERVPLEYYIVNKPLLYIIWYINIYTTRPACRLVNIHSR